jgi:2-polyprenyl-3-methyl-5-hydroxy-6-metoxy-1,4-benzoquinol methylase
MPPRKGWFKLPGQDGDRSVKGQLVGLARALEACRGKTVLDLGCAEGAIALEFARAGATRILGVEVVAEHLEVARRLCAGYPCEFRHEDLNRTRLAEGEQFDVVLALAIIHKLKHPAERLRYFAALARARRRPHAGLCREMAL